MEGNKSLVGDFEEAQVNLTFIIIKLAKCVSLVHFAKITLKVHFKMSIIPYWTLWEKVHIQE